MSSEEIYSILLDDYANSLRNGSSTESVGKKTIYTTDPF